MESLRCLVFICSDKITLEKRVNLVSKLTETYSLVEVSNTVESARKRESPRFCERTAWSRSLADAQKWSSDKVFSIQYRASFSVEVQHALYSRCVLPNRYSSNSGFPLRKRKTSLHHPALSEKARLYRSRV